MMNSKRKKLDREREREREEERKGRKRAHGDKFALARKVLMLSSAS